MSEHVCDAVCNQHEDAGAQARDRQWAEAVLREVDEYEILADLVVNEEQGSTPYSEGMYHALKGFRALVERMKNGESSPDGGETEQREL